MAKEKILICAYDVNPNLGSEAGSAFKILKIISKYYAIELYTDSRHREDLLKSKLKDVNYNFVSLQGKVYDFLRKTKMYNVLYSLFVKRCKEDINRRNLIHQDIRLIHCLTPAGIFTYNDLYNYGLPTIIGPLGGALRLPKGFAKYITIKYILRNIVYWITFKNKKWKDYLTNANKIIVGTEYVKSNLPLNSKDKAIIIFDVIVDTNVFVNKEKKQGSKIIIIYTGRLVLEKGCMLLLHAFNNLVHKGYDNVNLIILGSGKQYKKVQKFINERMLENRINLLGNVRYDQVVNYLQNADIYCLPTLREPGGTSIIEAMACGLAVVTTNYGGPAFSVTDDCGIKIDPTNYSEYLDKLTNALEYLINNKEEREKMGANARKRVLSEYSEDALEKKFLDLYNDLLFSDF